MRRGSNKPLEIVVSGADISLFTDIWVTVKQGDNMITKEKAELVINGNTITVPFTQFDTSYFEAGPAKLQIKYEYNGVDATDIKTFMIEDMLDTNEMGA